jgi:hypothetical protein
VTDQILSRREGRPALGGPYVGVPDHLRQPLIQWVSSELWTSNGFRQNTIARLMAAERIPSPKINATAAEVVGWILAHCLDDQEHFLDVINTLLQLKHYGDDDLDALLDYGGSVWTVGDHGLILRVSSAAQEAYQTATEPEDPASNELNEAWMRAYGRNPDASDAWDLAIKAVEAALIPIVVQTQSGPHMGHVIGQLDRQGEQWTTLLQFNQTTPPVNPPHNSVQALVGMLRLIYPNPDRHVGPDHRVPSLAEARAVVHLAVMMVQWARDGQIMKAQTP